MKQLNIGVIGTGHLGNLHSKFFSTIPNANLVGVFDIDIKKAEEVSFKYNCRVFNELENLFDLVDAVSIVTSTSSHYEIAMQALNKNKHIFLEKPITVTIDEGKQIVDLAKSKNLIIQVGHIERFNPAILAIDKYNLQPMFIQSDRLSQFNPRGTDVAVVLDLMIHDIDIILSLVKSPVKNIQASGVEVATDNIDIANARLEFLNGAVANVTASRISLKKMRKMRLFQKDTYFSVDFGTGTSEIIRLEKTDKKLEMGQLNFGEIGVGEHIKNIVFEKVENKDVNALEYELTSFVNTVLNNGTPVVTGEDGLRALIVASDIIKKIKENKLHV